MCEFRGSNGNGFGDIWWTDNLFYFSSIDGQTNKTSPQGNLQRQNCDGLVACVVNDVTRTANNID